MAALVHRPRAVAGEEAEEHLHWAVEEAVGEEEELLHLQVAEGAEEVEGHYLLAAAALRCVAEVRAQAVKRPVVAVVRSTLALSEGAPEAVRSEAAGNALGRAAEVAVPDHALAAAEGCCSTSDQ